MMNWISKLFSKLFRDTQDGNQWNSYGYQPKSDPDRPPPGPLRDALSEKKINND